VSAAVLGNQTLANFDTLIIGSGAGGGAVAAMLTKHGQNVLVLEAGANHFEGLDDPDMTKLVSRHSNDELKYKRRHFIVPDPLVEPRTFRTTEGDGKRKLVGDVNPLPKTVGGGGVHADLKTPRFMRQDFHLGTLANTFSGTSFADWPADYDVLEPFYTYVEYLIGVQGTKGPFDETRSKPYPMPPGPLDFASNILARGAMSMGLKPYPYPSGVNSIPYDGRPACIDCGFCSQYGCPIHAKGSPAVTTIRRALLSGRCQLWPETRVVKLHASNNTITGVEAITSDGSRMSFTATNYVLAASPIEDARLLFLSDPSGSGLGNSSGLVGRNLTFHLQTIALAIYKDRVHSNRGRATSQAVTDFRGVAGDMNHPLAGIIELGAGPDVIEEAIIYATQIGELGATLKQLMRQSPLRDHVAVLTMQAEDAPQATNRVDLDPDVKDLDGLPVARVTYKNHAFELGARDFYKPKLLDWLGASGAKYGFIAPIDQVPSSAHIMGTLRFGAASTNSVCRPDGRFWDIGNLYAADGSLFPTSSGFNPTLTIMTLATYVAAKMLFPDHPEMALSS
jgi:gluconate 2-dehydrogenase alpha chain